ncbi:MAG: MAPEG family protein [Rhodobacteraceae bacterium]|nr:MAPEG family protein [Paracoccaceae bacterium]
MGKRGKIVLGMAGGGLWGLLLVGGPIWIGLGYIPAQLALPGAFVAPGLFLIAVIGFLAQRRFFDDAIIDGDDFAPGSCEEIAQRVLTNTVEQLALALVIWPFVAVSLGGAVVLALGLGFACMRVVFWLGYLRSPPLRALGFAGTFYPTLVAALWSLMVWVL